MNSVIPERQGLYDPANEHDACGVGFVVHIKGQKSHSIIEQGLLILKNLDHRGAVGADPLMGDGAGILIQIPDLFLREEMARQGVILPRAGDYGVGMVFLPKESASRLACQEEIERATSAEGQVILGWRDVPVDRAMPMSPAVRGLEPVIRQVFIGRGPNVMVTDALERKLYIIRRRAANAIRALGLEHSKEFYQPSMSARTIVYKGLLLADQVDQYYSDLRDARCVSALAMVHQRFSTNTFPTWPLAHPFRMIAHNGEINTLRGNYNWMRAREKGTSSPLLGADLDKIWPLMYPNQSDTASFDNALELLVMGGYSLAHAMTMLIPEAWEAHTLMDEKRRAFYEYHAAMMEPWDGPAAMAFTDGRQIGATLDRNGLRPARYLVTDDDYVVMSSEAGVLPIPEAKIVKKWRLQPGKMFLIDIDQGRIIDDVELKETLSRQKPYQDWVARINIKLDDLDAPSDAAAPGCKAGLLDRQQAFGYTQEDIKFILEPMSRTGEEAIGSMGNDSPLAVLSHKDKPLYHYFRQLFAQVTNPPIDPIREQMVMSLVSFIGPKPNLLGINEINPPYRLEVSQPVLGYADMAKLRRISAYTDDKVHSAELDICYPLAWGNEGVEARLASLCAEAEDAVTRGCGLLIVSDRKLDRDNVAIPALLALSAVHQHLVTRGLRTRVGLVVETGSARETHHFAALAGYGAEAVHPYLALETIEQMAGQDEQEREKAVRHFVKGIGKGLLKVMSKMGISTYMSYTGAQIFEAIGLQKKMVDKYFTGTSSRVEGIGVFEVMEEAIRLHRRAFGQEQILREALDAGGEYALRARGDEHMWTPDAIANLQHSVRSGNYASYQDYARIINDQSRRHMTLRGLFGIKAAGPALALDEVEPAKDIVKRFATGAMSLGSISTEAHTTLAIAMNRIGGRSNTGEGGEDPARFKPVKADQMVSEIVGKGRVERDLPLKKGDSLRSSIKQVASGRFGVTSEYLVNADQIQIKMAQGAKPGEGGQLPGHKVSEYIGFLRHSIPGIGLVSPPPHHDIYSIEDLAQLIHDLKNVNSNASISVKLVSEVGVGTVAAGVTKAKADHLVISGHDGGTGASPLSSIKHAGSPWELGLAETQQTLVLNRLRGRVRVQVDGQIKTGRDVLIGALLGADEFGFATAPLVASGCIMMRKCHLNTCPVGVATQDEELRRRFTGQPEHVVNYFFFVAEELRELMAQIGIRKFDDLIGRCDLLDMKQGIEHWKACGLDYSRIFQKPQVPGEPVFHCEKQDHGLDKALDKQLIELSKPALEKGKAVRIDLSIRNASRTVGAMLSGRVVEKYGHAGLPDDTIHIALQGIAGQSFGAFLARGITLDLVGEGNDYVGKGLSGGRIVARPNPAFPGESNRNIIVGNTVLYGATEGEAFLSGVAGERFAVRNSGATVVVEGVGDHGCEYMTGGTVVVLGMTGRNFAAGMSGGVAFVFDEEGTFASRCNTAQVALEPVEQEITARQGGAKGESERACPEEHGGENVRHLGMIDETLLKDLVQRHAGYTGSAVARRILENWPDYRARFVKVMPHEYRRALTKLAAQKQLEVA
ncbi:MAG: glutamate synthase subunit alpha [Candidatus Accumulibacter sp.]|jgi:glutamate synthase (NADPH/NADH) large chain|nr:glutamate synthase subunit alpha [Accumulibacter sp.]